MIVLGIDPGTRFCGYGVVDAGVPGQCRYIECGVLSAPESMSAELRIGEIARSLVEVVEELAPVAIAVEDVFTRKNHRAALVLAQARGMVLAVAGLSRLPVFSYPAPVIKKAVTGHGRAPKEQVAKMVQTLVGLRTTPRVDATDALAVAVTHSLRRDGARRVSSITRDRIS